MLQFSPRLEAGCAAAGGSASYVSPAGGLYRYSADDNVIDEYDGVINLPVDCSGQDNRGLHRVPERPGDQAGGISAGFPGKRSSIRKP